MTNTTARVTRNGKHFEILVDLEEAMKFKKDQSSSSIGQIVQTNAIFHNLKSGEHASLEELEKAFGTSEHDSVAKKIILGGDVVQTTESKRGEQEKKYKQVVDFLSKNAVSPGGRPYTPDRIMKSLEEANVNIKNKPIDSQISEIMDQLSKVLPIKIEIKKIKLTIPAIHIGKAYGIVKEYTKSENWKSNGDLEVIIEMPQALIFDFYDKLNSTTHGSVISEEIKN